MRGAAGWLSVSASDSWSQLRSWSQDQEFEPCMGLHVGREVYLNIKNKNKRKGPEDTLGCNVCVPYLDCGVSFTGVNIYQSLSRFILKYVSFIVYQWYLTTALKNQWKKDCQPQNTSLLKMLWSTWAAPSVKGLTLGFGSGRDLTVCEFEPHVGLCTDRAEPAWDSLSLSLCPSPVHAVPLSLNK